MHLGLPSQILTLKLIKPLPCRASKAFSWQKIPVIADFITVNSCTTFSRAIPYLVISIFIVSLPPCLVIFGHYTVIEKDLIPCL